MKLSRSEAGKLGYKKTCKVFDERRQRLRIEAINNWKKENKKCPQCKKIIPYEKRTNKYCSHKCAGLHVQRIKGNRPSANPRFCLNCNKRLTKDQNVYCSLACHKNHRYEKYIENWKNKKVKGYTKYGYISNYIRKYLLNKRGEACEKCGWNERNPFTKKIPLQCHHKDGDYKNTTEENIEIICSNCHSLTKNYGGRGNNGRKWRRKWKKVPV